MPGADLGLTDWASISQIVLATTALLAFIGAIVQLRQARSATRETLTYNFTQRFGHPECLPFHQKTIDLFDIGGKGTTADAQWALFNSWKVEEKIAALLVPNLFEELAGMYNEGLLHKRITKDFFGRTSLDFWNLGWWFIYRCRESNKKYYIQWQLMLEDMDLLSASDHGP